MRRENLKSTNNWPLFYYFFDQDHSKPDLIWNYKTRQELKDGLETEIQAFLQDRELCGGTLISWNHTEFQIIYHSLADEIKIGDYFLRLLLTGDSAGEDDLDSPINKSGEFFNDLYHRSGNNSEWFSILLFVGGTPYMEKYCFHLFLPATALSQP